MLSRTGHLYVKAVGDDVWDLVHPVIPYNFAVPTEHLYPPYILALNLTLR